MLRFDDSFFLPEIRDGFYVSSKMKRTWAATLEVYKIVEKVCRDNNLKFYAAYGTLLGAIRHGGFIPWDDDFDLCMKREDYMRFIEIADKELPGEYTCLSLYRHSVYKQMLIRVVNREEFKYGLGYMEEFHGFPYNAGIDIFPLDYLHDDNTAELARQDLAKALKYHIDQYSEEETELTKNKIEIIEISEGIGFPIYEGKPVRQQMYQMLDKIMAYYGKQQGSRLGVICNVMKYNSKPMPASLYDETIRVPFENTEVYVPLLYDYLLETTYHDYMRCIRNWDTHEYPVYRDIEKGVHRAGLMHLWPDYTYDIAKEEIEEQKNNIINQEYSQSNEVVFMPYKAEHWRWMEPLWMSMIENEDIKTFVIPIPYYIKNEIGELKDFKYEGGLLPDYVPITAFDQYDLETRHPAKIIIQNIYDQFDTAISIPPYFYTERIKRFTDCLTCVPDFIVDEFSSEDGRATFNMDFYCTSPGVINADEVYVQSCNMRNRYLEKLIAFAGENTRKLWEKKIKPINWELYSDEGLGISEDDIPEDWWPKLIKGDGSEKKVLLYYSSVSCIAQYKEKYIDKVRKVFDQIADRADEITIIWIIDDSVSLLSGKYGKIKNSFEQLRKRLSSLSYVIVEGCDRGKEAVAISDAFYGDRGYLMHRFERNRRSIMIQNLEIE